MIFTIKTRWTAKQTGERTFDVLVPDDGDVQLINPEAVTMLRLSAKEEQAANDAALKSLVIMD